MAQVDPQVSCKAKLSVTTGPDRGRSFDLDDELVHIGRGTGNQIVLTDDSLAEHQASIVRRNGRFAIYTTATDGLEIEGNPIPPERWVWLPTEASIRISRRTLCQFVSVDSDGSADRSSEFNRPETGRSEPARTPEPIKPKRPTLRAAAQAAAAPAAAPAVAAPAEQAPEPPENSSDAPRQKRLKKNTARFITDGPGDPLVKLGADGHLPELRLDAGSSRGNTREPTAKQTNPLLFLAAIGASFLFSILMLFMDAGTPSEQTSKGSARQEIERYYGEKDERLEPYQLALRRARQAHSRRDYADERQEYRSVLNLLRAEGAKKRLSGLTGNKRGRSDEELETLISTLLSD